MCLTAGNWSIEPTEDRQQLNWRSFILDFERTDTALCTRLSLFVLFFWRNWGMMEEKRTHTFTPHSPPQQSQSQTPIQSHLVPTSNCQTTGAHNIHDVCQINALSRIRTLA